MNKIVVMVVDQQSFLRTELNKAIVQGSGTPGLEIIECDPGADGNEAVAQIDTLSPDVVLLDINFPNRDGLVLCRKIVRTTPQTKVVMLTSNPAEDDDELFDAIRSGASAYLMTESCSPQEFITTIERAARGEYPINDSVSTKPQIALRVLRQFEEIVCNVRKEDDISTPLNPKEAEILAHVVKGKANKEIGSILSISESAVKKHITSILRKLNANDRAHAVVLAVRRGVVSIQPNDSITLCNSDVSVEASDTIKEPDQIIEDTISMRSRILSDTEEVARQIIAEARQKGKDDAGKIIAEAVLEAERNAGWIIDEAGTSKSEMLADADTTAKQIIDEAEQDIENNAGRILAEVVAVAEHQGSQIILEAKRKAEVDAEAILEQRRKEAQSASEEIKAQAEIEASRIIAEAEQNAKQVVEHAKNTARSEAAAIVVEAHKRASSILQEVGNVQSKMLSDAEEAAKRLMEEASQKAEDDARNIVPEAEYKAGQIIQEATRKAQADVDIILAERQKAAQSAGEEIRTQAEIEARKIIAEAEEKAKRVIEDASNTSQSEASSIIVEAHKKASQIIQEAGDTKSKIVAEAEEAAEQVIEEAKQRGEADVRKVIAEAEHKASQIIEQAKQEANENASRILTEAEHKASQVIEQAKQPEPVINELAKFSEVYDGVIELSLAPPVNISTLCELHKQLKQNSNVDVLSTKGSVNEGVKIRMLVKTPIPILEFVKGISAVRDASVADGPAQSQTDEGIKRFLVTTY